MRKYTNPEAHGYLIEAKACKKIVAELDRLSAKYQRTVEREKAAKEAEFETVMQYRNEREIQDDYGCEYITEAQYERYLDIFQAGREALENAQPTVNEIILSILRRMSRDVLRDQQEWEFAALSPEEQEAQRKRAEESNRAWKKYISELKAKRQGIENMKQ